jgi:methionyl-tRNA formyltransferase
MGTVNVHPSLLPKYRGAAPLQWSIAKGETTSGVTIFYVVKEMDAGDIILQEARPIFPGENAVQLSGRFAAIGADLLLRALDAMEEGTAVATPQDSALATFAPKIAKADGLIDWRRPARELHDLIRGFQPWPGGYFHHAGLGIKVWRSEPEPGEGVPGQVLDASGSGPLVMTGEGALRLIELQPEGKKTMTGRAFLCGHPWKPGMALSSGS